ncbi:hypothetical protein KRR26_04550 [Corallococcus sp. M34]|uniref:hypothetical protein n=1 Tax=Citreicoccus inhibens TaxID=2849499 RepID=UPI001C240249|nr:hypothetical protein [Citreicoccus inhibens]MBU8894858.1 hypothetical protein [Citreicoccus inhibens]
MWIGLVVMVVISVMISPALWSSSMSLRKEERERRKQEEQRHKDAEQQAKSE